MENVVKIDKSLTLKIEKNIPIPPRRPENEYSGIVRQMEVGDSVYVPHVKEKERLCLALAYAQYKYATRKDGTGFRVWRRE